MGRSRLQLHELLEATLGPDVKLYFQPTQNISLVYPCVIYERENARTQHADNLPFLNTKRYSVTYIDEDPDSGNPDKIAALPLTSFNRFFVSDKLNHDVFVVYF